MEYAIANVACCVVIWPLGIWLLWQHAGWQVCVAVILLLFANNVQLRTPRLRGQK